MLAQLKQRLVKERILKQGTGDVAAPAQFAVGFVPPGLSSNPTTEPPGEASPGDPGLLDNLLCPAYRRNTYICMFPDASAAEVTLDKAPVRPEVVQECESATTDAVENGEPSTAGDPSPDSIDSDSTTRNASKSKRSLKVTRRPLSQRSFPRTTASVSSPQAALHPVSVAREENEDLSDIDWMDGHSELPEPKDVSSEESGDGEGGGFHHSSSGHRRWQLPDDPDTELDFHALASMPSHIRKDIVEDARRKERQRKRQGYLPVAADPELYSQTQLANFLRSRWVGCGGCLWLCPEGISRRVVYTCRHVA